MEFKESNEIIKQIVSWYHTNQRQRENIVVDTIHGINIVDLIHLIVKDNEDYNVLVLGEYYANMFAYYDKPYMYLHRDMSLNDMKEIQDFLDTKYTTIVVGFNFLPHDLYEQILTYSANRFMFIGDSALPKLRVTNTDLVNGTIKSNDLYANLLLTNSELTLNTLNKLPDTVQDIVYLANRFRKGQSDKLENIDRPSHAIKEGIELDSKDMSNHSITIVKDTLINFYNRKYRDEILGTDNYEVIKGEVLIFNEPFVIEVDDYGEKKSIKLETGTRVVVDEIVYKSDIFTTVEVHIIDYLCQYEGTLTFNIWNEKLRQEYEYPSDIYLEPLQDGLPNITYGYATELSIAINKLYDSVLIDAYMDTKTRYCYGALRLALKRATIVYKEQMIY